MITIFKNIRETETPYFKDILYILKRIKDGTSKKLVQEIRAEKDKSKRNELKKNLPAICFSGKFLKREDVNIQEHSGFICLDFDGYQKRKELLQDKQKFQNSKFVYSVFISPSGKGLKVVVRIPKDIERHKKYFNALGHEFESKYFDKTTKNISRVCYESYDPLIHINPNALVWDAYEEEEYVEVHKYKDRPTIPIASERRVIEILEAWFRKKYPMVEGQRNDNLYKFAASLNEYGVSYALASYKCSEYQVPGFSVKEIEDIVKSAYKNKDKHSTKYFEDGDAINQIKQKLKRGESKKAIRQQLEGSVETEVIDSIIDRAEEEQYKFWFKNEKGIIKIIPIDFKRFLQDNGFYKYCPEGSKNYVFIKVTSCEINHSNEKDIKDFVLKYLETYDDISVYNYFADTTRFFREDYLNLLDTLEPFFIEDDKESSYLYFKNKAVKVTSDKVEAIDYDDLEANVWKDQMIDRYYKECEFDGCYYQKFIRNICNQDDGRTSTMESTIGFLMHGHKNLSYCPAVILNDEIISDNPEGGTGKGIFVNALGQMKKLVTIDGKAFAFEKSFPYQLVSADTQILCFDDVKKYFEFERLFSVVTEGLTLEKKNKDAIKIPFKKSPKICITTNYAIRGSGNSFARRKWELELYQHYNNNYTPQDEFGTLFFGDDWNSEEWCQFDNYMISCLQLYLKEGLKTSQFVNLKIRQLSAETCHDFVEWCGILPGAGVNRKLMPNERMWGNDLYADFIEEYPDYAPKAKMTISRNRFYKWLNAFSLHKYNVKIEEGRDERGKWIIIHHNEKKQKMLF